jgi:hypothetical protein
VSDIDPGKSTPDFDPFIHFDPVHVTYLTTKPATQLEFSGAWGSAVPRWRRRGPGRWAYRAWCAARYPCGCCGGRLFFHTETCTWWDRNRKSSLPDCNRKRAHGGFAGWLPRLWLRSAPGVVGQLPESNQVKFGPPREARGVRSWGCKGEGCPPPSC